MEFFRELTAPQLNAARLGEYLSIGNLPGLCASVDRVIRDDQHSGIIYCVWGEFLIHREVLKHGVRFTLPGCPNALQFTVTCDANDGHIVIHCTINKTSHEADFINSIEKFVDDLSLGLRCV